MTPSEFKAWFDGFCEGIEGAPSKAQFERIKEQVEKIAAVRVEYQPSPHIQPGTVRPYWLDMPISNTSTVDARLDA